MSADEIAALVAAAQGQCGQTGLLPSVGVCLLAAVLAWFLHRAQRTEAVLERLFTSKPVMSLMHEKPGHADRMRDEDVDGRESYKDKYTRKTLFPAANAIERFAALCNCNGFVSAYSMRTIERTSGELLISLWRDPDMEDFVESERARVSADIKAHRGAKDGDGDMVGDTYIEFESLVRALDQGVWRYRWSKARRKILGSSSA